ncbi:hypothetical protein TVAG_151860 [Trichomonas vaginalis G3]|uniref:Transcription elongation factor Eaf N-terminal domain-containing protein n=1 Tax=Trichomonas vaginalis (strain ATCC PRA-98 / G3) TaxID=412133 RepID=A2ELV1_TRIV3|nr:hypothetical protein TVAG_151860 [Trichomonas vaginalis G3]|eukprot:XP_001318602.1 hypothetical protein [Trichomonas vaginalis G3]
MSKKVSYKEPVPFRIDQSEDTYMRVKYLHIPQSMQGEGTVSRKFVRDSEKPDVGYIYHTLKNGEEATFQGNLTDYKNDSASKNQECVLLFRDDEVICVPVTSTLLNLRKTND